MTVGPAPSVAEAGAAAPPAFVVQVVLYETPAQDVRSQLDAVARAVGRAHQAGVLGDVAVAYGDSSGSPCLDAGTVAALDATARAGGLGGATYHHFGANLGSGGGSNRLAELHDRELFLVLNPDAIPDARLLVELAGALADPTVGLCDGRQLPLEHPKAHDRLTGDTSWVSGACMGVRRRAFEQVGGFAADHFPMYCDDVDLSWQVRRAGWRVVHVPTALVFHDKRLGADGRVVPTASERYYSLFAGVLLARRWAWPDREAEILAHLEATEADDDVAARALAEWRRREAAGTLPDPLPGAAAVAELIAGGYGPMRF